MRHVYGIALAIVLGASVFFLGGWGYLRLLRIPVPEGADSTLPAGGGSLTGNSSVLLAFGAVALTALLAGVLIAWPRISPLAAGLPGLALLGWTLIYLSGVSRAVHYIPMKSRAFGDGFVAMGFNGVLAAAGIALVIPLFIPSRWRGGEVIEDYDDALEATSVSTPSRTVGLLGDWQSAGPTQTQPAVNPGQPPEGW